MQCGADHIVALLGPSIATDAIADEQGGISAGQVTGSPAREFYDLRVRPEQALLRDDADRFDKIDHVRGERDDGRLAAQPANKTGLCLDSVGEHHGHGREICWNRHMRGLRSVLFILNDDLLDSVVLVENSVILEAERVGALVGLEAFAFVLGELLQEGACELVGGCAVMGTRIRG